MNEFRGTLASLWCNFLARAFSTEIIFCFNFRIFDSSYHPIFIILSWHICGNWSQIPKAYVQASAVFENSAQFPAVFKPTKYSALSQSETIHFSVLQVIFSVQL